jgi:hypothetical protein
MHKSHLLALKAVTAALAVLLIVAVAPPARAGCKELLAAAKKGYRGDPAALNACKQGAASAAHAANAKPRARQSHHTVNDARDLKAFKHRNHKDPNVRAQMKGVTALRRADIAARSAHEKATTHPYEAIQRYKRRSESTKLIEGALDIMGHSGPKQRGRMGYSRRKKH